MATAAGLVIGGVALASLFETGMAAFEHIETAREYGTDYGKSVLQVSVLRLRLARWANGIELITKVKAIGTPAEAVIAGELLGDIESDIKKTEKLVTLEKVDAPSAPESLQQIKTIEDLTHKVDEMALRRHKKASFGQKTKWALRNKARFEKLLGSIDKHITSLEQLFPNAQERAQDLVEEDANALVLYSANAPPAGSSSETAVTLLAEATWKSDVKLEEAMQDAASSSGHNFRHIFDTIVKVGDNVKYHRGDIVTAGHTADGAGNWYRGSVTAGDNARIHEGNYYGSAQYVLDD